MALQQNDLYVVRLDIRDLNSNAQFINVLKYRCKSGELTSQEKDGYEAIIAKVKSDVATPLFTQLPSTVFLNAISVRRILPTVAPTYIARYATDDVVGGFVRGAGEILDWRAAAQLIRYNYKSGRNQMGRTYIGPLLDRFIDGATAKFLEDPALDGDMGPVKDALDAELTVTVDTASIVLIPSICPGKPASINSDHDQRTSRWADYPSYLRTRHRGHGG